MVVINRTNQRVFGHNFGPIQGGNWLQWSLWRDCCVIVANFGLKNRKIGNFQQLAPVKTPIQCRPNELNLRHLPTPPYPICRQLPVLTPWVYCTISIDSANMWLFHVFKKSQKIGKIEKKLFPRSEQNGCDAWRPNQSKWYSRSSQSDPGVTRANHYNRWTICPNFTSTVTQTPVTPGD